MHCGHFIANPLVQPAYMLAMVNGSCYTMQV